MIALPVDGKTFARNLVAFAEMSKRREAALYHRFVAHCFRSITIGSPTTGAPGQPVRKGNLLKSWKILGSEEARDVSIVSNSPYAHIIEHNRRGAQLRSKVGGFHSVRLTRLHHKLILKEELSHIKRRIRIRYA